MNPGDNYSRFSRSHSDQVPVLYYAIFRNLCPSGYCIFQILTESNLLWIVRGAIRKIYLVCRKVVWGFGRGMGTGRAPGAVLLLPLRRRTS